MDTHSYYRMQHVGCNITFNGVHFCTTDSRTAALLMRDSPGRVGVDPARLKFCSKSSQAYHPDWDWMFMGYLNSYSFVGGAAALVVTHFQSQNRMETWWENGSKASSRSYVLGGHVTVGSSGIPAWLGSNAPGLGAPWPERALA